MSYTKEQLQDIDKNFKNIPFIYTRIVKKILTVNEILKNAKAKEYLMHGVKRRIDIINQCIENIFEIYPPNRREALGINAVTNLNINLHSFLINVYGIIENLGLLVAYENNLVNSSKSIRRNDIGLYKKQFFKKLNKTLENYFSNGDSKKWYEEYAKNYRDALAHRIAPFIPQNELDEQEVKIAKELDEKLNNFKLNENNYNELHNLLWKRWTLGSPANYFLHSFSENSRKVVLHLQIISDFLVIEKIIFIVLDNIYEEY